MKISELMVKLNEILVEQGDGDAGIILPDGIIFDIISVDDEGYILAVES